MIRFFRHYIPANVVALLAAEVLILLGAFYLGVLVLGTAPTAGLGSQATVFTLIMLALMTAFRLYDWQWMEGLQGMLLRMVMSFLLGFLLTSQFFYLFPALFLGTDAFLLSCAVALIGVTLTRLLFVKWSGLDVLKRRVLVLGTGSRAARVEEALRGGSGGGRLNIIGYLAYGSAPHYVEHDRILADSGSLVHLAEKHHIDEIVVAVRDRRGGALPIHELLECRLRGIGVLELSSFFERENGCLQLDSLNVSWMIFSEGFHQGLVRDSVKRAFDLVASLVLLAVSAPVMALTAVIIRLESRGPILYRQERVGQGGRGFTIYKFRSMRVDAERDGRPAWATQNDSRVTRVGRVIRQLRIDELPQIFNVFIGDMSFVGPRPERPFFVDTLTKQIPYFATRHSVKPGITGWAQVRYPYGASVEDALQKLQYDLYYVKNHSLFLDLMILFQTAQVVLWGKGAR